MIRRANIQLYVFSDHQGAALAPTKEHAKNLTEDDAFTENGYF
jgi:hypothetical protein